MADRPDVQWGRLSSILMTARFLTNKCPAGITAAVYRQSQNTLPAGAVETMTGPYSHNSTPRKMMNTRLPFLLLTLSALPARAVITIRHQWSLGEAGAVTDSVGGANLTAVGTTTSVTGIYSSTAQDFANTTNESPAAQYYKYTGSLSASITGSSNWGMDFYVKPDFLPNGTTVSEVGLIHFGGNSGNSIAIELGRNPSWGDGNVNWMIQLPGVGLNSLNAAGGGVPAPTVGLWSHIVYVNNGGVGEFYVNGIKSSIPVFAVPGPSASAAVPGFSIGAMWTDYRRGLDGQMDEVRLFTFAPGQFNIADTVPEPSTAGFAALAAVGLMRRRRHAGTP